MDDPKAAAVDWLNQKASGYMAAHPDLRGQAKKLTDGYDKVQQGVDKWATERAQNGPPKAMAGAERWLQEKAAPIGQLADQGHREAFTMPMQGDQAVHPDDVRGMRDTRAIDKPVPQQQVTPDSLMAQAQTMLAAHKAQAEQSATPEDGAPSLGDRADDGSLLPEWLKGAAGR